MNCARAEALIDRHVNEGLTPDERESLEIHLRECRGGGGGGGCQQQLENLQRLLSILRSDLSPPVPEGFADRVMARAGEQEAIITPARSLSHEESPSIWKRLESFAGVTAALAAGLIVGIFMGNEAWRADRQQPIVSTTQPAEPSEASDFEYLIDPPGNSLAQAYLGLTTISDR